MNSREGFTMRIEMKARTLVSECRPHTSTVINKYNFLSKTGAKDHVKKKRTLKFFSMFSVVFSIYLVTLFSLVLIVYIAVCIHKKDLQHVEKVVPQHFVDEHASQSQFYSDCSKCPVYHRSYSQHQPK